MLARASLAFSPSTKTTGESSGHSLIHSEPYRGNVGSLRPFRPHSLVPGSRHKQSLPPSRSKRTWTACNSPSASRMHQVAVGLPLSSLRLVRCPLAEGGNRSRISSPSSATMSLVSQPAKHLSSARPSSPSATLRLAFLSSCAGHEAMKQPLRRSYLPRLSSKRSRGFIWSTSEHHRAVLIVQRGSHRGLRYRIALATPHARGPDSRRCRGAGGRRVQLCILNYLGIMPLA